MEHYARLFPTCPSLTRPARNTPPVSGKKWSTKISGIEHYARLFPICPSLTRPARNTLLLTGRNGPQKSAGWSITLAQVSFVRQ